MTKAETGSLSMGAVTDSLYRVTPLREVGERLEYRLNLSLSAPPSASRLRALWSAEGPVEINNDLQIRANADLPVFLTTYQRPGAAERVVRSLRQAADAGQVRPFLIVIDDGSWASYEGVKAALAEQWPDQHVFLKGRANLGKPGFWKIYATMFKLARSFPDAPALFLQDDIEFGEDLFTRIAALRAGLGDRRAAVLNLFACADDNPNGQWLFFRRQTHADRGVYLTQWSDLQCFFVEPHFFKVLRWRMFPISPHRWSRKPSLSSGVGRQLTLRLWGRGNIYQVIEPLAYHGSERSLMNPEARARRSLDNRRQPSTSD
ncbi:MAG: hypothetical protein U1E46_08920 [Hyphomicrobiales bacterium]